MQELPWEDGLLERKVESDLRDLLKTLVAFANSVRPGHTAIILIGEKDDGTIAGVTNPDNIQKKVREECEKIYPDIIWQSKIYEKNGKHCVRVEIEYSGETPHFGGPAWVRRGSTTIKASDEVFQRLIELRLEKVRELSKWVGQQISVRGDESNMPPNRPSIFGDYQRVYSHRWKFSSTATILSVNAFWVAIEKEDGKRVSEPIEKLMLSFDFENDRLMLIVHY